MVSLQSICRICLLSGNSLEPIENDLVDKILFVTSIQMTELRLEGFPNNICEDCKPKVFTAFEFKNQCIESNEKLIKTYSNVLKISEEKNYIHDQNSPQVEEILSDDNLEYDDDEIILEDVIHLDPDYDDNEHDDDHNTDDVDDNDDDHNVDDEGTRTPQDIGRIETLKIEEITEEELFLEVLSSMNYAVESTRKKYNYNFNGKIDFDSDTESEVDNKKSIENVKELGKVCEICGKTRIDIERHMRFHFFKKAHKCSFCNKAFSQLGGLRKHENIHTGNRPYKCNLCEKAFGDPNSLKCHKIAHHNGEKKYLCTFCGSRFAYSHALNVHRRIHLKNRQITCTVCSKEFLTKQGLKYHIRTHTGEKPYKCGVCLESFKNPWNLSSHKKTHKKEKS